MIKEIKQQEMYKIIILRIIRIFLVISHNFFFFSPNTIRTYLYRIVIPQTRRNVTYPFSLGKHGFSVART